MAKQKNKKVNNPQEKQMNSVYLSDLSKTMEARVSEFYTRTYLKYCKKRDNADSKFIELCLGLELFHECVKNLDAVLLGETPFSCRKIDKKAFMKNFTRKERYIANRAIKLFENAEIENNNEIEELQKAQTTFSRLLLSIWQTFKDCSTIISFACGTNGFSMLFKGL